MSAKFSNYTRWGNPLNGVLDDTEFYHWLIETQKFAYAQRTRLGDIHFVPEAKQLAKNMTERRFAKMLLKRVPPKAMFSSYYTDGGSISAQVKHYNFIKDFFNFSDKIKIIVLLNFP